MRALEARRLRKLATPDEKRRLAMLAIGRLLRIASRPFRPGDIETYYECRDLVLDVSKREGEE